MFSVFCLIMQNVLAWFMVTHHLKEVIPAKFVKLIIIFLQKKNHPVLGYHVKK